MSILNSVENGLVKIDGIKEYLEVRCIIWRWGLKEGWCYVKGVIKLVELMY